jgi:hypothetical protein
VKQKLGGEPEAADADAGLKALQKLALVREVEALRSLRRAATRRWQSEAAGRGWELIGSSQALGIMWRNRRAELANPPILLVRRPPKVTLAGWRQPAVSAVARRSEWITGVSAPNAASGSRQLLECPLCQCSRAGPPIVGSVGISTTADGADPTAKKKSHLFARSFSARLGDAAAHDARLRCAPSDRRIHEIRRPFTLRTPLDVNRLARSGHVNGLPGFRPLRVSALRIRADTSDVIPPPSKTPRRPRRSFVRRHTVDQYAAVAACARSARSGAPS